MSGLVCLVARNWLIVFNRRYLTLLLKQSEVLISSQIMLDKRYKVINFSNKLYFQAHVRVQTTAKTNNVAIMPVQNSSKSFKRVHNDTLFDLVIERFAPKNVLGLENIDSMQIKMSARNSSSFIPSIQLKGAIRSLHESKNRLLKLIKYVE